MCTCRFKAVVECLVRMWRKVKTVTNRMWCNSLSHGGQDGRLHESRVRRRYVDVCTGVAQEAEFLRLCFKWRQRQLFITQESERQHCLNFELLIRHSFVPVFFFRFSPLFFLISPSTYRVAVQSHSQFIFVTALHHAALFCTKITMLLM